jgi:hypothetical protein
LRGLLLFSVLAMMAMALFATGKRLLRADAELADYRREYGILNIENPAMLHAIALWTPEPNQQWRWRVHFPPGEYNVSFASKGICDEGFPKDSGALNRCRLSGIVDISASLLKDPRDGKWKCVIRVGGTTLRQLVPTEAVNASSWSSAGLAWNQEPTAVSPDQPLVLLRNRVAKPDKAGAWSLPDKDAPSDGLLLWIVREKDKSRQGKQSP